jgi:NAD(P)-dependent dehydrogenase (short-subunit alcohol dehydrogenase family)
MLLCHALILRLDFSVYPAIDPHSAYQAQTYKGKTVLIIGGSEGIGAEIALQYAKCGASLALIGRRENVLEQTKQTILQSAPDADIYWASADVSDETTMKKAVQGALDRFGKLDIVVANAASSDRWVKRACLQSQVW